MVKLVLMRLSADKLSILIGIFFFIIIILFDTKML